MCACVCVCGQVKPAVPKLFGGSDDDEEDGDEEEDDSRFDIRPQFEGPAGQKVRKFTQCCSIRFPIFTFFQNYIHLYNIHVQV